MTSVSSQGWRVWLQAHGLVRLEQKQTLERVQAPPSWLSWRLRLGDFRKEFRSLPAQQSGPKRGTGDCT